jgi:heat shock protein HtpX
MEEGRYAITLTRGLLESRDEVETEAVLAHELTHIRNEDVRVMVIAGVVTGIISFVAELVFRSMRLRSRRESGASRRRGGGAIPAAMIALVLIAVAWLFSQVIRFALSRSREYLADAGAVELTKNPDVMISALLKIKGRGELEGMPSALMEMCLDNPRSGLSDLFATHPSIDERIEALRRYAGGRKAVDVAALPDGEPGGLRQAG